MALSIVSVFVTAGRGIGFVQTIISYYDKASVEIHKLIHNGFITKFDLGQMDQC
jgi:amino acid permease